MKKIMEWSKPTKIHDLKPEERKLRLEYLRLKMKNVVNVIIFLSIMRRSLDEIFAKSLRK